MGGYSKQTNWAEHLNGLTAMPAEPIPDRSAPRRVIPRLPDDQIDELVRGYQDGASVYELANRFGIHRGTVSRHLHHAGVPTRSRGASG
jgi:DNA-directed RNA polymerase specialized sigma24 family protein